MTRLASRFGAANLIRRDRPLTCDCFVGAQRFQSGQTQIPAANVIPIFKLYPCWTTAAKRANFSHSFACQTRVRDPGASEHQACASPASGGANYR